MEDVTVTSAVYLGRIADQMDTTVTHLQTFLVIFGIVLSFLLAILFMKKYIFSMFSSWGGRFKL